MAEDLDEGDDVVVLEELEELDFAERSLPDLGILVALLELFDRHMPVGRRAADFALGHHAIRPFSDHRDVGILFHRETDVDCRL